MSIGNITIDCYFCDGKIQYELSPENATAYEEAKTIDGQTYKETFTSVCPKCRVIIHATFKQYRNKSLTKLAEKREKK